MASPEAEKLNADLQAGAAAGEAPPQSLEEIRAAVNHMLGTSGTEREDVRIDEVDMGGRRALVHTPSGAGRGAILHLHGGGLSLGSPESHSRLAAHLASRSGLTVYNLDYRLAPEHPFPAAIDDTASAVRWLMEQAVSPDRIVLSGDSGGGALVLTTLMDMAGDGIRLAGGVLMSPWADFRLISGTYDINAASDFMCSRPMMVPLRDNYLPAGDYESPRVSPAAAGDFTGLPPVLIQVSTVEVLLDDARLIARRAADAGVDAILQEYDVVPHVFQLFAGNLPEADDALEAVATWASRVLPD